MIALLNWRIWVLVGLLALGPILYMKGRQDGKRAIRMEWQAATAAANIEARQIEQHRETAISQARDAAVARATAIRRGVTRVTAADDGLRAALDAAEYVAKESTAAASKYAAALRANFDECRAEYKALGAEAAGHASDSLMYQQAWPK